MRWIYNLCGTLVLISGGYFLHNKLYIEGTVLLLVGLSCLTFKKENIFKPKKSPAVQEDEKSVE